MQSDRELREQQHIPYMPLSACLSLYSNRLVTCYLASLRSRVEFVDYLGRRRGGGAAPGDGAAEGRRGEAAGGGGAACGGAGEGACGEKKHDPSPGPGP